MEGQGDSILLFLFSSGAANSFSLSLFLFPVYSFQFCNLFCICSKKKKLEKKGLTVKSSALFFQFRRPEMMYFFVKTTLSASTVFTSWYLDSRGGEQSCFGVFP